MLTDRKSSRFIVGLLFLFMASTIYSQQTKNISVGDYIYVKSCKAKQKEFTGIDIYSRTVGIDTTKVDSITGDGFYEAFFDGQSSVEGKPLPCIMANRKYKIATLQELEDGGKKRRIALCYTSYYLNIIWVEIDVAMKAHEIEFR